MENMTDDELVTVTGLMPGGSRGGLYGDRHERIQAMRQIIATMKAVASDPVGTRATVQKMIDDGIKV